jgi:steroid delta-isomerase-like uncharacterized protein
MADQALRGARIRRVEEHVAFENAHDLEGVMSTFADDPRYDDTPWCDRHVGEDAVHRFYELLMTALPDLHIDVHERHVTDVVVLECTISGTHKGVWRGLPPTGRRVRFPLCAVYSFGEDDRLAGERIYYDRATVLRMRVDRGSE